jgi:molybdopterin-guanine dinucleotide biosynthesis protein A
MGRDKATVTFDGRPLWERQLLTLRNLNPERIFVSVRRKPSWLPMGTELLLDEIPSRGPLSGLAKALAEMESTHLIALAVDMPFMTTAEMRTICKLATGGRGVVPMFENCAEPLAAVYPREATTDFAAALIGPDFSLQRLVRTLVQKGRLHLHEIRKEARNLYRSVNEPDDLRLR